MLTIPRVVHWAPRVIAIVFALFISVFALDVFSEGLGPLQTIGALLLHLIPTFLVLGLVAVAWRYEIVGAVVFAALGVVYILWSWGRFDWTSPVMIAGPMLLVAALFLADWVLRHRGGATHGVSG
jgi:hypothetical protein